MEPKTGTYSTSVVAAKKHIIGANVVNAQNEDLGKIEDLAMDTESGRVAYAVLSFGGFLGMGDKLFAVPWNAFRFTADNKLLLNANKDVLKNAPGFDKDAWPDFANRSWGDNVYKHYGYKPYWQ